jgi:peptidoglycan hydrolase CwlO-like protein
MSTGDIGLLVASISAAGVIIVALINYLGNREVTGDKVVDEEGEIRRELREENKGYKAEVKELKTNNEELKRQNQLLIEQNQQLTKANEEQAKIIAQLQKETSTRDGEIAALNADVKRITRELTALETKYENGATK